MEGFPTIVYYLFTGKPVSLGHTLEWVIKLQEKHIKDKQIEHHKAIITLQDKLKKNLQEMLDLRNKIDQCNKQLREKETSKEVQEFDLRSIAYDLNTFCQVSRSSQLTNIIL